MNLLIVLVVLIVALLILVPLIERSGLGQNSPRLAAVSKWLLPLVGVSLLLQMAFYYLG